MSSKEEIPDVVEVDPSKIAEIDNSLQFLPFPSFKINANVSKTNEEEIVLKVIIKHLLEKLNVTSIAETVDLFPGDETLPGSYDLKGNPPPPYPILALCCLHNGNKTKLLKRDFSVEGSLDLDCGDFVYFIGFTQVSVNMSLSQSLVKTSLG
jgi:hypothetical protein